MASTRKAVIFPGGEPFLYIDIDVIELIDFFSERVRL
jgi:hypothetical protein